jgi:hypothetical protein
LLFIFYFICRYPNQVALRFINYKKLNGTIIIPDQLWERCK